MTTGRRCWSTYAELMPPPATCGILLYNLQSLGWRRVHV